MNNEWHDMFYLPNSKGVCPDDEHTIKEINDKLSYCTKCGQVFTRE